MVLYLIREQQIYFSPFCRFHILPLSNMNKKLPHEKRYRITLQHCINFNLSQINQRSKKQLLRPNSNQINCISLSTHNLTYPSSADPNPEFQSQASKQPRAIVQLSNAFLWELYTPRRVFSKKVNNLQDVNYQATVELKENELFMPTPEMANKTETKWSVAIRERKNKNKNIQWRD